MKRLRRGDFNSEDTNLNVLCPPRCSVKSRNVNRSVGTGKAFLCY